MELKELNPETLEKAAGMLKAMAHPVRISIVQYLEDGKKRTVTEIHNKLGTRAGNGLTSSCHPEGQGCSVLEKGREKYLVLS